MFIWAFLLKKYHYLCGFGLHCHILWWQVLPRWPANTAALERDLSPTEACELTRAPPPVREMAARCELRQLAFRNKSALCLIREQFYLIPGRESVRSIGLSPTRSPPKLGSCNFIGINCWRR
jgi:hypothetical protein